MPRRKVTIPRKATAADKKRVSSLEWPSYKEVESALTDFVEYLRLNPDEDFYDAAITWSGQQVNQLEARDENTKPVSYTYVSGRLKYVLKYHPTPANLKTVLSRIRAIYCMKALIRSQALLRQTYKAPWMSLRYFRAIFSKLERPSSRAERFKYSMTWLLLVSGSRPSSLYNCDDITFSDEAVTLQKTVTKNEQGGHTFFPSYEYSWSSAPPSWVVEYLTSKTDGNLPWRLQGTASSIASILDTFLQEKFEALYGKGLYPSTCFFRVRMDNVLAAQVRSGKITQDDFELLMEHTWKTSLKEYRRNNQICPCRTEGWKEVFKAGVEN